jgi:hypothetical protein
MKIDRSRETALKVVRDVSKVNAENVEMINLSREIAELGFEHQFERADRRAVRDSLRNLIEVQVKPELANEI